MKNSGSTTVNQHENCFKLFMHAMYFTKWSFAIQASGVTYNEPNGKTGSSSHPCITQYYTENKIKAFIIRTDNDYVVGKLQQGVHDHSVQFPVVMYI